jgi:DNA replication protein DnaC
MSYQQNIPAQLSDALAKLRLKGMSTSLPERNQEAVANQMTYFEFLTLALQDEILIREQKNYERRYGKAGFKGKKTIETFDFTFNKSVNQALIRDLATCRFIAEKRPVIITGPCGTGKSHIAQAIAHIAIQKGHDVLCTNQSKLCDMMLEARATNSYSKKLKAITKLPLLIIDDFGLKPLTTLQDEIIHEVIEERYELQSTVITSNLEPPEWAQAFKNKLLAVATIDRLMHNAVNLKIEGKSFRTEKNKN